MSIVDVAEFAEYLDTLSVSYDQARLQNAIDESQELIEDFLKRPLDSASRTEQCLIHPANRIYPRATPIAAVSAGTIENDGYAVSGISPDGGPFVDFYRQSQYVYATVTYTGGFTSVTAPRTLKRAVMRLAHAIIVPPAESSMIPVGATSVSLGDASVSFAEPTGSGGEIDALVPGLTRTLKRWRVR